MPKKKSTSLVPAERIEKNILSIRGHKVMLDADLADLYGVTTGALNQAVTRNQERFPEDFAFHLTKEEFDNLKSQIVISNSWGGRRKLPRVFTEQGVAMLSSVLRSGRAIEVNIAIMRTFVRLRQLISSNAHLARRLDELERKYDAGFRDVFDAIRKLMAPPTSTKKKPPIGFQAPKKKRSPSRKR